MEKHAPLNGGGRVVLAGDIGGTKTLLRLAAAQGQPESIFQKSYRSADYSALSDIVHKFLGESRYTESQPVVAACFAVAGPVVDQRARLTNLPWHVDADEISSQFDIPRVALINDFAAVGLGLERLRGHDLLTLQTGAPQQDGARLAVGAGTGLGVTFLTQSEGRTIAHASEGGHADFAPANEQQQRLLQRLRARFNHVSYERVLSGPGLAAAYEFVAADCGHACAIDPCSEFAPAQIAEAAKSGDDATAARAIDLFVDVYGAFAGSLALITLPTDGVYIAGGIAPKIAAHLTGGRFLRAFLDKGRYAELLCGIPIHVVMNSEVGLIGAVSEAAALAESA